MTAASGPLHTDGTVVSYMGTYVVRSGVITSFNVHQAG